ncbi:MAG TPA: ribonuclease Z [Desulfobacteraceae bacterium]|nr:ribonuclease Z [Deltaproteobacteria bacterium]MBW2355669.1 ribonuclease Z [Deltaproteobacteria bacterium]RLB98430.1 MAG: MBL fold metallo-hydrolase [Deltaproteobacteria bacterium]HDI58899.1 ribonuclease Z [Desulfobacteraceae bacterium]
MTTTVTILGSGTCVPSLKRSSAAILVRSGPARILVDVGAGTLHRLVAAGETVFSITHLLLTHFHPDHSGALPAFLFANKYPAIQRQVPLKLIGGPGLRRFFQGLTAAWGHWLQLPDHLFSLVERSAGDRECFAAQGFVLRACPVAHNPESLAYRITGTDGVSVVYSGDTDTCDALVELARGADVFICEASLPDGQKVPGHLTPSLAGRLAARAAVAHLVLTHLYPECDGVDIAAQCRRTWSGPLTVARDLMQIRVTSDGIVIEETGTPP